MDDIRTENVIVQALRAERDGMTEASPAAHRPDAVRIRPLTRVMGQAMLDSERSAVVAQGIAASEASLETLQTRRAALEAVMEQKEGLHAAPMRGGRPSQGVGDCTGSGIVVFEDAHDAQGEPQTHTNTPTHDPTSLLK